MLKVVHVLLPALHRSPLVLNHILGCFLSQLLHTPRLLDTGVSLEVGGRTHYLLFVPLTFFNVFFVCYICLSGWC